MVADPGTTSPLTAVIFDFNGTLFRDAAFHDAAWASFGRSRGISLTPSELERHVLGFANREILAYLFGGALSDKETLRCSREKERLYRELCAASPERCLLAPGAELFLDELVRRGVKRTIATASIRENVDFFIRTFRLDTWFEPEDIVYDDGELRGKPFPDMFLAAGARLGTPLSRCMVIEDSIHGVEGAKRAGAGAVVAISKEAELSKFAGVTGISQVVSDFSQIDRRRMTGPTATSGC